MMLPNAPYVWSTLHCEQLVAHGYPSSIPYQGASSLKQHCYQPQIVKVTSHVDYRSFAITLGFLFVLPTLFYALVAPYVWHTWSPVYLAVVVWLHLTSFCSLMVTSITDPGILPRFTHLLFDPNTLISSPDSHVARRIPRLLDPDPLYYELLETKIVFQRKYCSTCKLYRDPRAFHCHTCDACIMNHDHHCSYVNNCIGKGNYRAFVTFLTHSLALALLVLVFAIMYVLSLSVGALYYMVIALCIATGMLTCSLGPLVAYHYFLILRNQSTHEHARSLNHPWTWTHKHCFGYGLIMNVVNGLCKPLTRQYILLYNDPESHVM